MKTRRLTLMTPMLEPGMVIAAEIRSPSGRVLLTEGQVLDSDAILQMRRRGIEMAAVLAADRRSAEKIAEAVQSAERRVAQLFRMANDGGVMRERLQETILAYRRESEG